MQPGFGVKDHARAAIQTLSEEIPARRVYAHTGWRKIGGDWKAAADIFNSNLPASGG